MVKNCHNLNDNSGKAHSFRFPLATSVISRSACGPRRSSEYMALSVPVHSNREYGNTVPENGEVTRLACFLLVQQRLERHVTFIRYQQACLSRRIASLKQYFMSMGANIWSIAQHSVCVEQHIPIILRCLTSWSRNVRPDGHARDFGRLCSAIVDKNDSINFGNDTDDDSD